MWCDQKGQGLGLAREIIINTSDPHLLSLLSESSQRHKHMECDEYEIETNNHLKGILIVKKLQNKKRRRKQPRAFLDRGFLSTRTAHVSSPPLWISRARCSPEIQKFLCVRSSIVAKKPTSNRISTLARHFNLEDTPVEIFNHYLKANFPSKMSADFHRLFRNFTVTHAHNVQNNLILTVTSFDWCALLSFKNIVLAT